MKLYVYCLAENLDTLNGPTRGISGAGVRLLKMEGFTVLVSDYETDVAPVTRENALAHAAVVRSVLNQTTPLPLRFGTLVTETQLRDYVSIRKPALENKLAHVRGCVEMNVKIILQLLEHAEVTPSENDHSAQQGPGTAFLTEKRREILGDERKSAQVAELSSLLGEAIGGLIRDEQITLRPSEGVVLAAAAHLIEGTRVQTYREKMAEARENRPDLHFLVSGPWPPYSFANIELEFKTLFGVS